MTWMRETPYSLHYYPVMETSQDTQGNDLGHSKNVKDWAIRRRVPKAACKQMLTQVGHGTVSETAKASVTDEGLTSQRLLKVQSSPLGNMGEKSNPGVDWHIPIDVLQTILVHTYCIFSIFYIFPGFPRKI